MGDENLHEGEFGSLKLMLAPKEKKQVWVCHRCRDGLVGMTLKVQTNKIAMPKPKPEEEKSQPGAVIGKLSSLPSSMAPGALEIIVKRATGLRKVDRHGADAYCIIDPVDVTSIHLKEHRTNIIKSVGVRSLH